MSTRANYSGGRSGRSRAGSGSRLVQRTYLFVDVKALARESSTTGVAMLKARVSQGVGSDGKPLRSDLINTGSLLASLGTAKVVYKIHYVRVEIGGGPEKRGKITNGALGAILHHGRKVTIDQSANRGISGRKLSRRKRRQVAKLGAALEDRGLAEKGSLVRRVAPIPWLGFSKADRAYFIERVMAKKIIRSVPGSPGMGRAGSRASFGGPLRSYDTTSAFRDQPA